MYVYCLICFFFFFSNLTCALFICKLNSFSLPVVFSSDQIRKFFNGPELSLYKYRRTNRAPSFATTTTITSTTTITTTTIAITYLSMPLS